MPVIAESSLVRGILTPARAARASMPPSPPADPPPAPHDVAPFMSLEAVLHRRRSVRTLSAEPVSAAELDLIVRSGLAAERTGWPPGRHPAMGVTIAVAACAVSGMEPGLYLPEPTSGAFAALSQDEGLLAGLAAQYTVAPVLLFVCGNLTRACAAFGQRGYPQLLVRAGAAGYGAWLAAVAAGLSGCAYGRTNHRVSVAVRRHGVPQHGGGSLRHLFTVAVGRTLSEDSNDL